jgi:serine/threonine-protein kinase
MLEKHHALLALGSAAIAVATASCGGGKSSSTGGGTGGHTTGPGATTSTSSAATSSGMGGTGPTTTTSTSSGAPSSSAATGSSSSSSGSSSGSCAGFNVVGGIFKATEPWNTAVDQDPVSAQSSTIINWLASAGGWGNGNKLQIDFSINILCADATTPAKPFVLPGGACDPDCDNISTFPVPPGGAVEGETGYACTGGGDCHLLVVDKATNKLWEMWQAFEPPDPNVFNSTSGAFVWDLTKAYPMNLRGDGCTSADAGGFPIAAMLFTADEIAAGHIDHAIRFILPNARIQDGPVYVHPATHTGVNTKTTTRPNAPPYGVHLRLKQSFDITKLNAGSQVVAKAMQKYGMFLSDGGNIALTAANDQFTTAKWTDANVNLTAQDLVAIQVTDFDVVDMGALIMTGDNCMPANRVYP